MHARQKAIIYYSTRYQRHIHRQIAYKFEYDFDFDFMLTHMPGKKRNKAVSDWDSVKGWKQVDVGDDFLLGEEEFGFAGLEELDGSACGTAPHYAPNHSCFASSPHIREQQNPFNTHPYADIETLQSLQQSQTNTNDIKKKKNKTRSTPHPDSVEQLQARIKSLEKENKQLKKKQKNINTTITTATEKDPPHVDVSAWQDFHLSHPILDAISALGFSAPTHIQAECLPAAIRDGRDIIGAAQTGSGKTLSFGLPILQLLSHRRQLDPQRLHYLRALILAPTRELAMQVSDHISTIARGLDIWVVPIVGGISAAKQERLLGKKPEIVVATPGRLWDMMKDRQEHVSNMRFLEFLVIDEADRMVQQGHFGELSSILDALRTQQGGIVNDNDDDDEQQQRIAEKDGKKEDNEEKHSKKRKNKKNGKGSAQQSMQTFVFSATLTLPTEMRKRLRKGGGGSSGSASLESLMDIVPFAKGKKPKIVDLTSKRRLADNVTEACISCTDKERDDHLYCLLASHPGRTIVFVNAISSVRRVAAILKILRLPVQPLHAGMQQRARLKALDRFKADENAVMIATDVAARGLDVKDVKCVVHYQVPASVDVYVHRSGRTARADNEGIAIAFVTPKEEARFAALMKALGREMPPEFPVDASVMAEVRKRVSLAIELDGATRTVTKKKAEKSWRKQQAEQLGLILSDDEDDDEDGEGGVNGRQLGKRGRKQLDGVDHGSSKDWNALQARLDHLLAEPLQPKFSKKYFTGGAVAGIAVQQQHKQQGSSTKESNGDARMVHKAVEIVERVTTIRNKDFKKKDKDRSTPGKGVKETRAAVLAAAVRKQLDKKKGKHQNKKGGLVVVPQAFGRESQGPDALQALRNRLARLGDD